MVIVTLAPNPYQTKTITNQPKPANTNKAHALPVQT